MEINYIFNLWDSLFAVISILISVAIAIWIYKLEKKLTAQDKYKHEVEITKKIIEIGIYRSVILANVKKYHPLRKDKFNKKYYKQGAELYTVVSEYGVQFILNPKNKNIPVGLIPFEWIEYIRDYDSEDNKSIIVCKFKGIKWYKRFRSPFKEINYIYENPNYAENSDPDFMKFTTIKPSNSHTKQK